MNGCFFTIAILPAQSLPCDLHALNAAGISIEYLEVKARNRMYGFSGNRNTTQEEENKPP